jgi:hypothetical protein
VACFVTEETRCSTILSDSLSIYHYNDFSGNGSASPELLAETRAPAGNDVNNPI